MPVTHKGGLTVQGVETGLATICPLCNHPNYPVRWEDRQLVNWNGKLRWAHTGCVNGLLVFKKRRRKP